MIVVLFLAGYLIGSNLYAKCPEFEYVIRGVLKQCDGTASMGSARVFVYINNSTYGNVLRWLEVSSDGRFEAKVFFHTYKSYSRWTGRHNCGKDPTMIGMVIAREGQPMVRKEIRGFKVPHWREFPKVMELGEICADVDVTRIDEEKSGKPKGPQ